MIKKGKRKKMKRNEEKKSQKPCLTTKL